MRIWPIFLALGILQGCASQPIELPSWDSLEPASEEIQYPLSLPEIPAPASSTDDTVTFTKEAFRTLTLYVTAAGGNYDIAVANAEALERQSAAYNYLIEAGKLQRQFAQIREEQLAKERQDHIIDNLFHRGIIALGLIGLAL